MRLRELLIEEGLVDDDQMQEALRAQVIYGGRIGTNLVELGHLHIDQLADALGRHHHLAAALAHHFDEADRELQRRLPAALAAELEAVPLKEELPGVVAVAFLDPPSAETLAKIGEALGSEIVPVITPELRLRYQLEIVYRLPRPNRYVRVGPREDEPPAEEIGAHEVSERMRRTYIRPLSEAEPEPPDNALGRLALKRIAAVPRGAAEPEAASTASSIANAIENMRRATERDLVVELAVTGMRNDFDQCLGAGLFLLVREGMAIGWHGFSRHADDSVVQTIAIPLDEPSVLRLSYQTQVLVCGKPPAAGELIDRRLWHILGTEPPEECIVAPIALQERVVCLLYAHNHDRGPICDEIADAIEALAREAGSAFVRLIRATER